MLSRPALRKTSLTAALAATAGLMLAPAVLAQTPSPAAPPATSAGPAPAVTDIPDSKLDQTAIPDSKLDQTAAAVRGISAVKTDFQQKVAQAKETDKERLASEANAAMTKAVTDQGLSVAEYTNIITVAQNDPAVHQKLVQRLKK